VGRALPEFPIAFLIELHYAPERDNYLQIRRKFVSFVLFGLRGKQGGIELTGEVWLVPVGINSASTP
jgi:hypothetical protein